MTYLKRAWYYTKRKISKSLLLFFIVFLLGSLISSSLVINQATKKVKDNMKSQLGALISLTADSTLSSNIELWKNYQTDTLKKFNNHVNELYDSFKDNENILYAELVKKITLGSNELLIGDSLDIFNNIHDLSAINDIPLYGISRPSFGDLEEKNIILTSGRTFSEDEINKGSNVVILDANYQKITHSECVENPGITSCSFQKKALNIGDSIKLVANLYDEMGTYIDSQTIEYEIIGFYQPLKDYMKSSFDSKDSIYGRLYVPENNLMNVIDHYPNEYQNQVMLHSKNLQEYLISSMTIHLKNPEYVEKLCDDIKNEINALNLLGLDVMSSTEAYEAVCGPLESLSFIATIILVISTIITVVVLSLVVTLFIKDRKHEIGIYVSLGERRWKIALQIMMEVMIAGIFALFLSLFSGKFIGAQLSENMLDKQIEKQQEIIHKKLEQLEVVNPNGVDVQVVEDQFEVKMNTYDYVLIFVSGSMIMILSSLVPVSYTLRIKPKDILM